MSAVLVSPLGSAIATLHILEFDTVDVGFLGPTAEESGRNEDAQGSWAKAAVPDVGSSLALLSLSLTALGVAARQFKRAAA